MLDIYSTDFFSAVPSVTATDNKLLALDPITELVAARSLLRLAAVSETDTVILLADAVVKMDVRAVDDGIADTLMPDIFAAVQAVIASPRAV